MSEHLGYEKHDSAGRGSGNSRNGTRAKTVLTEIGPVEIEVSRDTESTFEPQIVRKRQRRLTGVDEIVLSLTARGLTTGEIAAHFHEVYGAKISKDTVSRITDKGDRRDDRLAEPALREGLPRDLHRRDGREGP
jgi:putative transposase